MSQPAHPYYGVWIDWSYGQVRGATLTIRSTYSGLLTAFIALLVSAAGGGLWKILAYIAHQLRARRERRDGLYHQQQILLRNSASPSGTLIDLLHLTWAWRRNADIFLSRSLPLELGASLHLGLVALGGIFSSSAIKAAGADTLTQSSSCGQWFSASNAGASFVMAVASVQNITLSAANYASACYASTPDPLQCKVYTTPTLPFTTDQNASCPFVPGMCYLPDTAAYKMDTGKLDSNFHLGINTRPEDRITYQRITTCAPLNTDGLTTIEQISNPGNAGTLIETVHLGPNSDPSSSNLGPNSDVNATYVYNNNSAAYVHGYTLG
jgi:hypothetical protein